MKAHKPSSTAASIAGARARESAAPEGVRICYDPYAIHFISRRYRVIRRIPLLSRYLRRRRDRILPGMFGALVARTRLFDDRLQSAIEGGIEQLVILGAGYDTRAYRFESLRMNRTNVFEVDHPATQRVKVRKILKILGAAPEHVVFVPVRFNRQSLADCLFRAGYEPRQQTLFIWEGVTMYLYPMAVDATLRFVAGNSAPGSSVLFDCLAPEVVDGRCDLPEAKALRARVTRVNEPLRFGINEMDIPSYLKERGFGTVEVINSGACKALFFQGPNADRKVSQALTFVHAFVAKNSFNAG